MFWTMKLQHPCRQLSGGWIVIVSPTKPPLPQASGAFLSPLSSFFRLADNSNFSLNAPAQFQRILRRSETIVKLQMDEILRFWAEVACEISNFCGNGPVMIARE